MMYMYEQFSANENCKMGVSTWAIGLVIFGLHANFGELNLLSPLRSYEQFH